MSTIAEKLKTLRKSHGYTQADICQKLKVSRSCVGNWELGTRIPNLETLEAFADLYNVNLDFFRPKVTLTATMDETPNDVPVGVATFKAAPNNVTVESSNPVLRPKNEEIADIMVRIEKLASGSLTPQENELLAGFRTLPQKKRLKILEMVALLSDD